ncbi:MAG: hypothetical protein IJD17_06820 [Clostridia bacterium]|nr:hypothetical protein [Clostridia bacterium]
MNMTEKAAYIKGLLEGMNLDENKPETKLFNAIVDCLNEMAMTLTEVEEDVEVLDAYIEEVDEDLGDVEEYIFGDDDCCCCDDDDCDCCCDDECEDDDCCDCCDCEEDAE